VDEDPIEIPSSPTPIRSRVDTISGSLSLPHTPQRLVPEPGQSSDDRLPATETDTAVGDGTEHLPEPPTTLQEGESGVYTDTAGRTRAFATASPRKPQDRQKTTLDPVLPSNAAWVVPGQCRGPR
jgi:hypothetical protein